MFGLCLGAHLLGGADQVEAAPFDNLHGHGFFAVVARSPGPILERQTNVGQIAKGHDTVAIHLHRQAVDVALVIKAGRDLDRKRAIGRFNFTRRDQLVVVDHNLDQLCRSDVIGLKPQRIDDHLDHLVALAGQLRL